jgi:molecular chaperone GrpE
MDKNAQNKNSETDQSQAPTPLVQPPALLPLTTEQIELLKDQAAKAAEYWDRYLRQTADLDNFKKRAARERQDAVTFANQSLLLKLLPVLDAFEMALAAADKPAAQSLQAGVALIASQLKSVLAEAGLEEIDAAGKPFDPNLHEALSQQESADTPDGQVLRQLRKGYIFRHRLLRPAGVIVAKRPAP